jgi:hypothetical protein
MVGSTMAPVLFVGVKTAFVYGHTKGMVADIGADNVKSMEMPSSISANPEG